MSVDELEKFINFFSNFHPIIKFISQISTASVIFLDTIININVSVLTTTAHSKPTDSHSYLLYTSSCKDAIPYNFSA